MHKKQSFVDKIMSSLKVNQAELDCASKPENLKTKMAILGTVEVLKVLVDATRADTLRSPGKLDPIVKTYVVSMQKHITGLVSLIDEYEMAMEKASPTLSTKEEQVYSDNIDYITDLPFPDIKKTGSGGGGSTN